MSFRLLEGTRLESISHPAPFIQLQVATPCVQCRSRAREDPKHCAFLGLILIYGYMLDLRSQIAINGQGHRGRAYARIPESASR